MGGIPFLEEFCGRNKMEGIPMKPKCSYILELYQLYKILLDFIFWLDYYHRSKILVWNIIGVWQQWTLILVMQLFSKYITYLQIEPVKSCFLFLWFLVSLSLKYSKCTLTQLKSHAILLKKRTPNRNCNQLY